MTLSFKVLGIEVARIDLDLDLPDYAPNLAALAAQPRKFERTVERGVKAVSKAWVKRMVAG